MQFDALTLRAATADSPVVVRAANPGKAVLAAGSAMVVKKSAHVVVDGLTFLGGANTMLKLESSNNVRVTHNTFDRGSGGEGSKRRSSAVWSSGSEA